jgi:hypothetical protein
MFRFLEPIATPPQCFTADGENLPTRQSESLLLAPRIFAEARGAVLAADVHIFQNTKKNIILKYQNTLYSSNIRMMLYQNLHISCKGFFAISESLKHVRPYCLIDLENAEK